MAKIGTNYRSYLLRLWRKDEPTTPWQAMLESVADPHERHYFKDLSSLMAYLLTQDDKRRSETEGGMDIE
jgi:hypothetical protein